MLKLSLSLSLWLLDSYTSVFLPTKSGSGVFVCSNVACSVACSCGHGSVLWWPVYYSVCYSVLQCVLQCVTHTVLQYETNVRKTQRPLWAY